MRIGNPYGERSLTHERMLATAERAFEAEGVESANQFSSGNRLKHVRSGYAEW